MLPSPATSRMCSRIISPYYQPVLSARIISPYYQPVFDINVLASSEEGLGISVIEGSACALPAVVSNCTGLPETIIEGETGLLFTVDDPSDLSQQLLRLTQNATLRASLGHAGRAFADTRFSATSYDEKFMAVVDELLKLKGGRA